MANIKKILVLFFTLLIIIAIFFYGNKIYNKYISKEPTPVTMTIDDSKNPFKLKETVNDNNSNKLTTYQAQEASSTITKIIDNNRKPSSVITTTGSKYVETSKVEAKKVKADDIVITPAKGETKQISDIKPTDTVTLNQYNIKAYPEKQIGVAYYSDRTLEVEYTKHVKVFGAHAYVGPAVKMDSNQKVSVGAKLIIPF